MRSSVGLQTLLLSSILTSGLAFAQSPLTPAQRPCGGGSECQVADNSEEAKVNLVNLSVKVEQVIDNDTMVVKLYHEAEGATALEPIESNTEALATVFKRVGELGAIKVSSGTRRAIPIYFEKPAEAPPQSFPNRHFSDTPQAKGLPNEGAIVGWRERAEITLQSRDFKLLSTILSDLAGDLQIERMSFKVSDEARKAQEGQMLDKALADFREKASLTSMAFNATTYGLVNVSVGEVMLSYDNQAGAMPMMAYKGARNLSAPEVAGGDSKFSLSINGTIQLFKEGR